MIKKPIKIRWKLIINLILFSSILISFFQNCSQPYKNQVITVGEVDSSVPLFE